MLTRGLSLLAVLLQVSCVHSSRREATSDIENSEQIVSSNGVELWLKVLGRGNSKVPLVYLHGGPGGSSNQFLVTTAQGLAENLTIVVLDQRGCGKSSKPKDGNYSMRALVADVESVRNHLGVDKIGLLGSSFGGEIALEYALQYPSRAKYVILEGSSHGDHREIMSLQKQGFLELGSTREREKIENIWSQEIDVEEKYTKMWSHLSRETVDKFLFSHKKYAEMVRKIWESETGGSNQEMVKFLWGSPPKKPFLYERVRMLSSPVLILVGREDKNTGLAISKKIHSNLKNSKIEVFEKAAHFPQLEKKEAFVASVVEFAKLRTSEAPE